MRLGSQRDSDALADANIDTDVAETIEVEVSQSHKPCPSVESSEVSDPINSIFKISENIQSVSRAVFLSATLIFTHRVIPAADAEAAINTDNEILLRLGNFSPYVNNIERGTSALELFRHGITFFKWGVEDGASTKKIRLNIDKKTTYSRDKARALSYMCRSFSDNDEALLDEYETAKSLWNYLQSQYSTTSDVTANSYLMMIQTFTFKPSSQPEMTINEAWDKLKEYRGKYIVPHRRSTRRDSNTSAKSNELKSYECYLCENEGHLLQDCNELPLAKTLLRIYRKYRRNDAMQKSAQKAPKNISRKVLFNKSNHAHFADEKDSIPVTLNSSDESENELASNPNQIQEQEKGYLSDSNEMPNLTELVAEKCLEITGLRAQITRLQEECHRLQEERHRLHEKHHLDIAGLQEKRHLDIARLQEKHDVEISGLQEKHRLDIAGLQGKHHLERLHGERNPEISGINKSQIILAAILVAVLLVFLAGLLRLF
ncbi:hypothetical protein BOTCAL_0050g00010 [Botryotinia calthae]|uniref:CCHC-type domain-containing protein n=1 Tax=Botryotinia calthae TaxID=38488 RepID=A0A4Y8DDK2_9HELO|nr:hypothetical protein BOTCAL_0050g00010 [Botryotinia calthae]